MNLLFFARSSSSTTLILCLALLLVVVVVADGLEDASSSSSLRKGRAKSRNLYNTEANLLMNGVGVAARSSSRSYGNTTITNTVITTVTGTNITNATGTGGDSSNATVIVGTSSSSSSINADSNSGSGSSSSAGMNGIDMGDIGSLPNVPGLDDITIPGIPNHHNNIPNIPNYGGNLHLPNHQPTFMPTLQQQQQQDNDVDMIGVDQTIQEDGSTEIVVTVPGDIYCFPGTTMVYVMKDKKKKEIMVVEMSQLQIGDWIAVRRRRRRRGNDNNNNNNMEDATTAFVYEPIYSFGHYEPNGKATVLEIRTDSLMSPKLQISHSHLVFIKGSSSPVPSSSLRVGDQLLLSSSSNNNNDDNDKEEEEVATIQSLKNVMSNDGLFAPFTPSGTFLVNDGIVVSSYVALMDNNNDDNDDHDNASSSMSFFNGWIHISHHWMAHAFQVPHRMVCYHFCGPEQQCLFCPNETYSSSTTTKDENESDNSTNGISMWVYGPMKYALWILNLPSLLVRDMILLPLVIMFAMMYVLEQIFLLLFSSSSLFHSSNYYYYYAPLVVTTIFVLYYSTKKTIKSI